MAYAPQYACGWDKDQEWSGKERTDNKKTLGEGWTDPVAARKGSAWINGDQVEQGA